MEKKSRKSEWKKKIKADNKSFVSEQKLYQKNKKLNNNQYNIKSTKRHEVLNTFIGSSMKQHKNNHLKDTIINKKKKIKFTRILGLINHYLNFYSPFFKIIP